MKNHSVHRCFLLSLCFFGFTFQQTHVIAQEVKLFTGPGSLSSFVIDAGGALSAWGQNFFGQLGVGFVSPSRSAPLLVPFPAGNNSWQAIAAGGFHALAVGGDGRLYAWGDNTFGQLGNGITNTSETLAVQVSLPPGMTNWTPVAAGYSHSVAIGDDGQLYAWGSNQTGQLGNGTSDPNSPVGSTSPARVLLPDGVTRWLAVSAGYGHNLALGDAGKLYAWGSNRSGEIGDGTLMPRTSPVPIVAPSGVGNWSAFTCGNQHNLALDANCRLFAWGNNTEGGMGGGTTTNTVVPVPISSLRELCHPPTNR